MDILIAIVTGLAVGLHNATWGMYKDAPHEGFTWSTYFRSVIAGLVFGPVIWYVFRLDLSVLANVVALFGSTYALERVTMEVYKTFLRREDQSKYFIPMQLSVFGKPVKSYSARLLAGAGYVSVILLITFFINKLNIAFHAGQLTWSKWLILLPCSLFGWISAFGGAWKDAPVEGFETFKFFRSPGVAYFYAFVASLFTSNLILITMCSIGFTIMSIETYKTFFFLDRPRGKFQGMPIHFPEWETKRKKFVPLYVAIWIGVLVCGVIGYLTPHVSFWS